MRPTIFALPAIGILTNSGKDNGRELFSTATGSGANASATTRWTGSWHTVFVPGAVHQYDKVQVHGWNPAEKKAILNQGDQTSAIKVPGYLEYPNITFQMPEDDTDQLGRIKLKFPTLHADGSYLITQVTHSRSDGDKGNNDLPAAFRSNGSILTHELYDYPGEYAQRFDGIDPADQDATSSTWLRVGQLALGGGTSPSVHDSGGEW